MAADDLERLVASAQGGLKDALELTEARKRRDLIAAAQVQATCAIAVALDRLAAVLAVVSTEEKHE